MQVVPSDVTHLLGPNEQVQLYVKEKIYHPTINVDSIILTNERIILRHPRDLGLKKDYTDYSYTDIANVILDKGILRSSVKCVLRFGGDPPTPQRPAQRGRREGLRTNPRKPGEKPDAAHISLPSYYPEYYVNPATVANYPGSILQKVRSKKRSRI